MVKGLYGFIILEIEKLKLGSDIESQAIFREFRNQLLKYVPGIALIGVATGFMDIADYPRLRTFIVNPWQYPGM